MIVNVTGFKISIQLRLCHSLVLQQIQQLLWNGNEM